MAADDGMVLAGHGRLAAGKLLKIALVPVIVAHGWSERRKRAYVIAAPDNRLTHASDWDDETFRLDLTDLLEGGFELSLTGITEESEVTGGLAAMLPASFMLVISINVGDQHYSINS